jgi:hypothetical protein
MGHLPICCCSKAKKFNDFSRAGVGVYVQGASRRPPRLIRVAAAESRGLVLVPYTMVPGPTVVIQRKEIVASLLPAPR